MTWEDVIQIAYFPTPDAMIAAAIFGKVFHARGTPFAIFETQDPRQEILDRNGQNYIFIGHQSSALSDLAPTLEFIGIINPEEAETGDQVINPQKFGYDIPDITLSTLAYLMCEPLVSHLPVAADYIIVLPLVAQQAITMKSKPSGLQEQIHLKALEEQLIQESSTIGILGSEVFSINEALVYSQDPFLPNLTDNENRVIQLLNKADIVVETNEGDRKFSDLDPEELKNLNIALVEYLANNSVLRDNNLNYIRKKYIITQEKEGTILYNTWDFARAVLDAMNRDQTPLALTILLGNRGNKLRDLTRIFKEERKSLATSFDFLLNKSEEIVSLSHLNYLRTDRKISWYNASIIASMVLAGGLAAVDQPFVAVIPGPHEFMTLGIRASNQLNLGDGILAMLTTIYKERDLELAIQGNNYAAQAQIPADEWEEILIEFNSKVKEVEA